MPPVRDIFYQWSLSPDRVIGLFPDWFAPRYADWPLAFLHGGFVRFEAEGGQSVPPELNRSADPLVVFTAGSAGAEARSFFAAAVAASRGQRWRSLLLTGFDNHLEGALPENVSCHPFIPLSVILPKSRLLVHHGGLGSASAALMAGIPQLVVPFGHDHFDNADRVKRLGVGREFRAKALKTKLTDAIMEMLRDETLHQRAIEISHRFPSDRSLSSLCAMIEAPLNERLRAQQASRRSSLTP
jgi:UDP:flavonoid glycosyltransferase YjiC (YdhE family)